MPAPTLPRHRKWRVDVLPMQQGVKMKLGVERQGGGDFDTFATPHLGDNEAAQFLGLLQAGASAVGLTLKVDYRDGRGSDHMRRRAAVISAAADAVARGEAAHAVGADA